MKYDFLVPWFLPLNEALVDNISPGLRAVALHVSAPRGMELEFVHDGEPDPGLLARARSMSHDFARGVEGEDVTHCVTRLDHPAALPSGTPYVFRRRESAVTSPAEEPTRIAIIKFGWRMPTLAYDSALPWRRIEPQFRKDARMAVIHALLDEVAPSLRRVRVGFPRDEMFVIRFVVDDDALVTYRDDAARIASCAAAYFPKHIQVVHEVVGDDATAGSGAHAPGWFVYGRA